MILAIMDFFVNSEIICFENGINALEFLVASGEASIIFSEADVLGISGIDLFAIVKKNGLTYFVY